MAEQAGDDAEVLADVRVAKVGEDAQAVSALQDLISNEFIRRGLRVLASFAILGFLAS